MASTVFSSGTLITSVWLNDVNGVVWTLFGGATTAAAGRTALGLGTLAVLNSPLSSASGGTGVANNSASTLTISGNFATTFTVSGTTGVTLPTTGTLATLAGAETLTNKALNGTLGATTPAAATVTSLTMNSYSVGTWTTPAFNAGDFTANSGGSWTVEAGDVTTFAYNIINKIMTVSFVFITTTVVGGGSVNTLSVLLPASKTSTKAMFGSCSISDAGGARETGEVSVTASGTSINFLRAGSAVWSNATNTTALRGQLTFEIN